MNLSARLLAGTAFLGLCCGSALKAASTPDYTIERLHPVTGTVLRGTVEVRVMVTPAEGKSAPAVVFATMAGPPWARMTAVGDNEWLAVMDTTLVPNGERELEIITSDKRSKHRESFVLENPLRHYFADLHSHTSFSDGTLLPRVAHEYARYFAELDIFSLTDHMEQVSPEEWREIREAAWDANEDGAFVAIPALEWTTKNGHACIYDPLEYRWPREVKEFYEEAARLGVVAKFNHPGDGSKVFDGMAYSEEGDKAMQMTEVRRDTEQTAWIRALRNGWHIAPDGSDDTHSPNWGNVKSWTGVLAPGLSRRTVWHALRNRHVYSALDRNCRLSFEVCGGVMGDILEKPVRAVSVKVVVHDPDEGDITTKVELFEDGEVVEQAGATPAQAIREWTTTRKPLAGKHFYFVKVTQADGNLLWSAPVWVTVAAE